MARRLPLPVGLFVGLVGWAAVALGLGVMLPFGALAAWLAGAI